MSNLHFIMDMETIGQSPFKNPIVNCAYYMFDWDRFTSDNPYDFRELVLDIRQTKLDVKEQVVKYGDVILKKDLDWWSEQGESAKKAIKPSFDDVTLDKFFDEITYYVEDILEGKKLQRWWTRSNCFDPIFFQRCAERLEQLDRMNKVLPFWLLRDTRTYIDTRFDFSLKKNGFCPIDDEKEWNSMFVMHNSIHDVAADILRMQKIERAIHL